MVEPTPLRPGIDGTGGTGGSGYGGAGASEATPQPGGGGGGGVSPPATKADLERLHMIFLIELAGQGLLIVGVLIAIYFGNVASNQQAGALGLSAGQVAGEAAERAVDEQTEAILDELRRQEKERDNR